MVRVVIHKGSQRVKRVSRMPNMRFSIIRRVHDIEEITRYATISFYQPSIQRNVCVRSRVKVTVGVRLRVRSTVRFRVRVQFKVQVRNR